MTNHPMLRTTDEIGVPVWPLLRNIDGYYYVRESVHPAREAAEARVHEIRAAGGSAQAFSSAKAKFETDKAGTGWAGHPGRAAVYTRPEGKDVQLDGDAYALVDRLARAKAEKPAKAPKPAKAAKPGKGKKAAKKPAKESEAVKKARAKLAAQADPELPADEAA